MFYRPFAIILAVLLLLGSAFTLFRHRAPAHEGDLVQTDGYGGTITLDLVREPNGTIKNLAILDHNETPSYINDPASFLFQFTGKDQTDSLELGKDIDGITRATVTSRAITEAVHATIKGTPIAARHRVNPWDIILPLALLSLALAALLLRINTLRWIAMVAGFIYFGLIAKTMFSTVQVTNAALLHIPLFAINVLWWMTLTVSILPALIIGRIYCSSLCPFALVQEILRTLSSNRRADTRSAPTNMNACPPERRGGACLRPAIKRYCLSFRPEHLKHIILIFIILACFFVGNAAAANIEVFTTLFSGHGTLIAWSVFALTLTASLFYGHFWCRFLCPAGALLGVCATIAPVKIRPSTDCDLCGACSAVCPTEAINTDEKSVSINEAECILCGNCLRACDRNFLALRRKT